MVSVGTSSLTVSWSSNSLSGKWEVETVPAGTTPTGSGTIVTSSPHIISNLTKNTCYDVYVRIVCGDEGSYSPWIKGSNFCTNADYCGGDHFYDAGGANGNYNPGENFLKTIYPENAGDRVIATFNKFNVESCCSYFTIYDGPNNSGSRDFLEILATKFISGLFVLVENQNGEYQTWSVLKQIIALEIISTI